MDDLQAVTRALVDNDKAHRVTFAEDRAEVFAGWLHARFDRSYAGVWELTKGSYDRRPETITGLLNSIKEA